MAAWRSGVRRSTTVRAGMVVLGLWIAGCSSGPGDAVGSGGATTTAANRDLAALIDALERLTTVDSVDLTFTLGGEGNGEGASLTTEGQLDFTIPSGTSVTSSGGDAVTVVIDGDRTWLRYDTPEFDAFLPEGAGWIEAPTDELVERGVVSVNPDVTWAPLYLLHGAENIDVDSTGLRSTFDVDVAAIRPALDPDRRAAFDATLGGVASPDLITSAKGAVTLDGEGRIIAFHAELQLEDPSSGEPVAFLIDLTMGDFGLPVTVTPPPADQVASVADHPDLLDQLSGPGPGY